MALSVSRRAQVEAILASSEAPTFENTIVALQKTGAILDRDRYDALIELCRHHGLHLLHDEIFNGLGPTGTEHLPFVADVYEKGLSLNVMSKAYGLPGLRLGWIASHDTEVLSRMERMKHYLSICL